MTAHAPAHLTPVRALSCLLNKHSHCTDRTPTHHLPATITNPPSQRGSSEPAVAVAELRHGRRAEGCAAVPGHRQARGRLRQGGGGVAGRGRRRRRGGREEEGARRGGPGVAVLAQARGGQGRAAVQGAGALRVRDQRTGPREPRVPAPQRQADGERAGRPRALHQQGVQREPGQAAGHHRRHLRADPARPRAQRRPVRGHLQLLLRRLRPHHGAGPVPDLRGVVPGRHGRLRRLRGRLRPGEAPPDRLPLQDLLHLLPPGHPGPAAGAALHARPALPRRRAHPRRQGRRAPRLRQQLHQLMAMAASGFMWN